MINSANGDDADYRFRRGFSTLYHTKNDSYAKRLIRVGKAKSNNKYGGSKHEGHEEAG
jgi:hypothetical protein